MIFNFMGGFKKIRQVASVSTRLTMPADHNASGGLPFMTSCIEALQMGSISKKMQTDL